MGARLVGLFAIGPVRLDTSKKAAILADVRARLDGLTDENVFERFPLVQDFAGQDYADLALKYVDAQALPPEEQLAALFNLWHNSRIPADAVFRKLPDDKVVWFCGEQTWDEVAAGDSYNTLLNTYVYGMWPALGIY